MIELPPKFVAYHQNGGITYGKLNSTVTKSFDLWPLTELQSINEAYCVSAFAPSFIGIGTDGGDEMFAFDPKNRVVVLPVVGMEAEYARVVARSWSMFERLVGAHPPVPATTLSRRQARN